MHLVFNQHELTHNLYMYNYSKGFHIIYACYCVVSMCTLKHTDYLFIYFYSVLVFCLHRCLVMALTLLTPM